MTPSDDDDLRLVLREWRVPDAPDTLVPHVPSRRRPGWLAWLRGDIRVPVPVAVAFCLALLWLAVAHFRGQGPAPAKADDLRGFEPDNTVNVRIERTDDATR